MHALYSARAEELAAERRRHDDECLLLSDDNKELRSCLQKTTKQLGVANRQIEMQATDYSRTSFELRREKARAEVNSGSSSLDFVGAN
jgi:indole-3-glycerol phosphate synthase